MAIRRFICRRGPPTEIFSDNGTNFQGASNEQKRQLKEVNLTCAATLTDTHTKWSFNPPSAPHVGGVWERIVRSVKEGLNASDDRRRLNDEILITALKDAENWINSRPLTYMPQTSADNEALTPNHFILGSSTGRKEKLRVMPDLAKARNETPVKIVAIRYAITRSTLVRHITRTNSLPQLEQL